MEVQIFLSCGVFQCLQFSTVTAPRLLQVFSYSLTGDQYISLFIIIKSAAHV